MRPAPAEGRVLAAGIDTWSPCWYAPPGSPLARALAGYPLLGGAGVPQGARRTTYEAQIAAQEARRGHNRLAGELKKAIEGAKVEPVASRTVTPIARPRGDLADLVIASFPDVGCRDLVLPDRLHEQISEVLAEQRQRRSLAERGFAPVHRLLLEGPPGTGKTMTAAVLAHELSLPLLTVRLDSLLSKFLGETAAKLRLVFDAVRVRGHAKLSLRDHRKL